MLEMKNNKRVLYLFENIGSLVTFINVMMILFFK